MGDVIRLQQGHELWCCSSREKPSMLLLLQQKYFPACEHSSMHVRHANVESAHLREKRQHHQQWYEIIKVCAMFSFFVSCTSYMLYEHLKVRSSIIQVGPVRGISFWSGLIFFSDFVFIYVRRSVCRSQGQTATIDFALCVCNLHSNKPSPFRVPSSWPGLVIDEKLIKHKVAFTYCNQVISTPPHSCRLEFCSGASVVVCALVAFSAAFSRVKAEGGYSVRRCRYYSQISLPCSLILQVTNILESFLS